MFYRVAEERMMMAKKSKTTTFLVELPLVVEPGPAKRVRAHLEAARQFYNAVLSQGQRRLRLMRADAAWQAARALPPSQKQARKAAFGALRQQYGFSEYGLHAFAATVRVSWLADHLDSTMAQTLATRAYQALNRVCVGQAKQVRFKSKHRGLDSVEGKRNDTGLRFVLQKPSEGNQGHVLWGEDRLPVLIDWKDPVVTHGLKGRVKYVRLIRRKVSSPQAQGADSTGHRYSVQLMIEGKPYQKPKNHPGRDMVGLDIGPASLASFSRQGPAQLQVFCEELQPNVRKKRLLARKMDRQRRATNPQNYDEHRRIKKQGTQRLRWHDSQNYQQTRRQYATNERKLAAHRKSLHGRLVNELVRLGNHIQIEKTACKGWQKRYGKSVGLHAPGMFVAHLRRTVAKTGGILSEISTYHTKLSQYCHGCQSYVKKPLWQRWHTCACGIGPIQRDLYSAFLLAYLDPADHIPSIAQHVWAGAESRLMAAVECIQQRANAGQSLPQSFGIPGARARRPQSLAPNRQEPALPPCAP
jgi:transposase